MLDQDIYTPAQRFKVSILLWLTINVSYLLLFLFTILTNTPAICTIIPILPLFLFITILVLLFASFTI